MIEKIYLILTGEDEKKRPRSKKLLKELKKQYKNSSTYEKIKIIITGKSGFDFNRNPTEAEDMRDFLVKENPGLLNSIILENEAMDTFGNMVFSYPIVEKLIKKKRDMVEVVLITEKFHMRRSRMLFNMIFNDFLKKNKIKLNCKLARTYGINLRLLKLHLHKFWKELKKLHFDKSDLLYYLSKEKYIIKRETKDFLVSEVLFLDLGVDYKNKLNSYNDYRNFLFSLPIYNEFYKSDFKFDLNFSLYKELIEKFVVKK